MSLDQPEFAPLRFVVVPREVDDETSTIEIWWKSRSLQWQSVWMAGFSTMADRDLVFEEMATRQSRWREWGQLALFAGASALNEQLLSEVGLPPTGRA